VFQIALDIETETKDQNNYMDSHMVRFCVDYKYDAYTTSEIVFIVYSVR